MSRPKTVLILGGGVGGVVTARALRRRLSRAHRIVLTDREREHLFAPSLLWLMVGLRDAASIQRPLRRLERRGIGVRIGEVERIDPAARRVTVGGEVFDADYTSSRWGLSCIQKRFPNWQKQAITSTRSRVRRRSGMRCAGSVPAAWS